MSSLAPRMFYKHFPQDKCRVCGSPILTANNIAQSAPRWKVGYTYTKKNGDRECSLLQVCDTCGDMEIAIVEAEAEMRRFTHVAVYNSECEHGTRCNCGAVRLVDLDACVHCSIAGRMLTKAQAKSREIANLLKQLRKQAKEALKEETHGR